VFGKCDYCFVAADVADFHAEGICVGMDCAIPEIEGLRPLIVTVLSFSIFISESLCRGVLKMTLVKLK
jgi:hypothetical protein